MLKEKVRSRQGQRSGTRLPPWPPPSLQQRMGRLRGTGTAEAQSGARQATTPRLCPSLSLLPTPLPVPPASRQRMGKAVMRACGIAESSELGQAIIHYLSPDHTGKHHAGDFARQLAEVGGLGGWPAWGGRLAGVGWGEQRRAWWVAKVGGQLWLRGGGLVAEAGGRLAAVGGWGG